MRDRARPTLTQRDDGALAIVAADGALGLLAKQAAFGLRQQLRTDIGHHAILFQRHGHAVGVFRAAGDQRRAQGGDAQIARILSDNSATTSP